MRIYLGSEKKFFSGFSLIHFLCGMIAYQIDLSFNLYLVLHLLFEVVENYMIRHPFWYKLWLKLEYYMFKYVPQLFGLEVDWEHYEGDSLSNSIGDTIYGCLGWLFMYYLYS